MIQDETIIYLKKFNLNRIEKNKNIFSEYKVFYIN